MTKLKYNALPEVGKKDSTEEPKVATCFNEVATAINGELEGKGINIKAKTIDEGSLETALVEN
jgi:hypothetical protein